MKSTRKFVEDRIKECREVMVHHPDRVTRVKWYGLCRIYEEILEHIEIDENEQATEK
jgi:hypothetical protein